MVKDIVRNLLFHSYMFFLKKHLDNVAEEKYGSPAWDELVLFRLR